MSTNRFLTLVNGVINFVTAISSSTGVSDANKIVSTGPDGRLDNSVMPSGIGAATETISASETLSAGDFVNIWNDAGTRRARKAAADNARAAMGFVLTAVTSGQNATVVLQGVNTGLTGLTPGTRYFLGTNGAATTTAPTTATHINQSLGVAISATGINFEYNDPIVIGA